MGIALVARLVWVLWLHPPEAHIESDMAGYVARAEHLLAGDSPTPAQVFFPWGTHHLLAALFTLGGSARFTLAAITWAALGAATALAGYRASGRLIGGASWADGAHSLRADPTERWALTVGVLLALGHFPLLALTGFFLSEIPFCFCLMASAASYVGWLQGGRARDALLCGCLLAAGYALRPQLLLGLGVLCGVPLLLRSTLPRLRSPHLALILLPSLAPLGWSAAQSARHEGAPRLVPSSAALNRAFARCHAWELTGSRGRFVHPALAALAARSRREPTAWLRLRPVINEQQSVETPLWRRERLRALGDTCAEQSGWIRQAQLAATNVILLWLIDPGWPTAEGQTSSRFTRAVHLLQLLVTTPLVLVAGLHGWRRRDAGVLALAALWASVLLTAALYTGSTRLRVPYDPLALVLAATAAARLGSAVSARVGLNRQPRPSRPTDTPSAPRETPLPAPPGR